MFIIDEFRLGSDKSICCLFYCLVAIITVIINNSYYYNFVC